jgi:hypothetical protein
MTQLEPLHHTHLKSLSWIATAQLICSPYWSAHAHVCILNPTAAIHGESCSTYYMVTQQAAAAYLFLVKGAIMILCWS